MTVIYCNYTANSKILCMYTFLQYMIKMAHGHGLMSLPNFQYFRLHCSDMKAIKLLNDQDVLVYDRTRIKWNRDLGSLRNFVENILGFTGAWKSTGGKSKQFANSNSDVIITWYPGKLNSLTFNGKNGEAVKKALVTIYRQ